MAQRTIVRALQRVRSVALASLLVTALLVPALPAGATPEEPSAAALPKAIVTGTVSDEVTLDAIEGAWVFVSFYDPDFDWWDWVGYAETNAAGVYTVYDEGEYGAGLYEADVWATGYRVVTQDFAWNGSSVENRDFDLAAAQPIATGVVTDAATGFPIEEACVEAYYDEWYIAGQAMTNAAGVYTLYDEWERGVGDYELWAGAPGYRPDWTVRPWDGAELLTQDFALEPWTLDIVPVAGGNRYETAVEASRLAFPEDDSCDAVIIASGGDFPDALGGASLAGALQAPVLLTKKATLPGVVAAEIARLGASEVYIIGGEGAVSKAVETVLAGLPGIVSVERIGGGNRYETAAMVAERTVELLGTEYWGDVMFATGTNFPDALAATPLAVQGGVPILLVKPTSIPAATLAAIDAIDPDYGLVLGGTGAVNNSVYGQIRNKIGVGKVKRLRGGTRYETAAVIAQYGMDYYGLDSYGVGLATGADYPDALAGGVAQGLTGNVLLLTKTNSLDWNTADKLAEWAWGIWELRFFGGSGAISEWVREEAREVIEWQLIE